MSNLSELIPSGGGQNQVEFVASGTLPNGKPVILNSDGTVTVVTGSGAAAAVGAKEVYKTVTTTFDSITMLTDTKALVAYRDNTNEVGGACVLDISGTTVTAGTAVSFGANPYLSDVSVAKLSSTKVIVAYTDGSNNDYGTALILDISGSAITVGNTVAFNSSGATQPIAIASLSSTKAIVSYRDHGNNYYGTAVVLTISGASISVASEVVFESANAIHMSTSALSPTQAVVVYADGGNNNYGTSCILSVSGTTITAGTPVVFESASINNTSVTTLTSTKAIVAYKDVGNSSYGTACILDISGSAITAGTPAVFESAATSYTSLTSLSSTVAFVTYQDGGNSNYGTYNTLGVSGSTITIGNSVVFLASRIDGSSSAALTSDKTIIAFRDVSNSSYGTSVAIQTDTLSTNLTATNLLGISAGAISSGATGTINLFGGINESQSSLTIGSDYYVQTNGTITTASASPAQRIGTAISATQINIKDFA